MKTLARERDTGELLGRLRTVRPDSARLWGRMSAHQMICHLADGFRMADGEKAVPGTPHAIRAVLIRWIALHTPLPWPRGVKTLSEVDQEAGGTCPTDFAADLAELESRLSRFASRRNGSRPPHPIFGRLSESEWLRWGYRHVDHHLRQFGA